MQNGDTKEEDDLNSGYCGIVTHYRGKEFELLTLIGETQMAMTGCHISLIFEYSLYNYLHRKSIISSIRIFYVRIRSYIEYYITCVGIIL